MKQVVIGFSAPSSFKIGAKLIQLWMGGTPYSHVYLKMFSGYTSLTLVYQASHGYVNCVEYTNFCDANKVVAEFEMSVEDTALKSTIKRLQELLQRPYGKLGLIKIVLFRVLQRLGVKDTGDGEETFHCSELIARIEPKILDYSEQKDPDLIEPVHAYKALEQMNLNRIK